MKQLANFSTWPVQNEQLHTLYQRLSEEKAPHALLLLGKPDDTKKLAEYLAKLWLCTGDSAPCGTCESCRQFDAGSHPDFVLVDGVEAGVIKTAEIEGIQSTISLRSHHGGVTVYVLCGMDAATPVAANRLLKTLEEPLPSVKAILTSTSPAKLLPTIKSRVFAFSTDAAQGTRLAAASGEVLTSATGSETGEDSNSFVTSLEPVIKWTYTWLTKREPSLVLAASLQELSGNGQAAKVLNTLALWLQTLLHARAGMTRHELPQYQADVVLQAPLATVRQFAQAVDLVTQAKSRLQAHVTANLNFEQLCIRLREVL